MPSTFHLPGISPPATAPRAFGSLSLRVPALTPELLREQLGALRLARREHLADRPVAEIVEIVDAVAGRLLDPVDPLRREAEEALPAVTGYSLPVVRLGLDRMAADWRAPRLQELLEAEFGDPRVLDEFRPRAGAAGSERAFGPELVAHVFSGNVPGVAVTSLIRALLVKAASIGKTASGEPVLPVLFARAVAEVEPGLGRCLAVAYWPGGEESLERAALAGADAVVVYGGGEAVAAIRRQADPSARVLGYGPRLSFGVLAREALGDASAREYARAAALEVATFDQQGCVSPHLFYVEEGGATSPAAWAEQLATALAGVEAELPRGALSPDESAAIQGVRGEAEFAQIAGGGDVLFASPGGTSWTVVFDPDPAFRASCLNRVVRVKPIADLGTLPEKVSGVSAVLQTVGVAGPPSRVAELAEVLGRLGASRIAPLGQMAWPPPAWHHDGHPPLRELVRWCDLEAPS